MQIAIPYSVIVDVDRSTAMDFSETIEVKVLDQEDKAAVDSYDSYFFAYFHNMAAALDQIRDAVKTYKPTLPPTLGVSEVVHDTTYAAASADRTSVIPTEPSKGSSYGSKLASLLRPFTTDTGSAAATPTQNTVQAKFQSQVPGLSGTYSASVPNSLSSRSGHSTPTGSVELVGTSRSQSDIAAMGTVKTVDSVHTYPPPPSPPSDLSPIPFRESSGNTSSWGVSTWLRNSRRVFASPSAFSSGATIGQKGAYDVVSDVSFSSGLGDRGAADLGYSVLETRNAAEPEVVEKFRATFALDEREPLLGCK